jgi:hypothetical protein
MRGLGCVLGEHAVGRIAVVTALTLMLTAAVVAEPCNPVIDGTYCATDMRRPGSSTRSSAGMRPIQSIGGDILVGQDQPATFGGITFQGSGTQCIGLLRRGRCN